MEVKDRWDKLSHNFGTHKPGVMLTAEFTYKGDKEIQSWRTSCGCTSASRTENTFSVGYKTKPIPENLVASKINEYQTSQTLFIQYKDGDIDQLHIKVHVKE